MAITLRSTKGGPLTHSELDANFAGLADSATITGIVDSAYIANKTSTTAQTPLLQAFNQADSATYNQFGAGTVIFLNDGDGGDPCLGVKDSANGQFKIISFGSAPSGGGGF